jgi:ectoine hydroxylase-related dioxygenase (phytanoyl-CoA dioxygenase family)
MAQNGVWIEGVPVEGLKPVNCVPMVPGDVLIFNPYVVHGSMPNVSDKIRYSIDCRFFGSDGKSSKHYLDLATWSVTAPEKVEQ